MEYDVALKNAWSELASLAEIKRYNIEFLNNRYNIELEKKQVLPLSSNIPPKDYICILMLHYLLKSLKGLPSLTGKWISFKDLAGGQGYYPTFKKRVIDVITRKYEDKPDELFKLVERFKAKSIKLADISIVLEVFSGIPLLIAFWRGDEEFCPEVDVLFDKSIEDIFCTEDIAILSELVAHSI